MDKDFLPEKFSQKVVLPFLTGIVMDFRAEKGGKSLHRAHWLPQRWVSTSYGRSLWFLLRVMDISWRLCHDPPTPIADQSEAKEDHV